MAALFSCSSRRFFSSRHTRVSNPSSRRKKSSSLPSSIAAERHTWACSSAQEAMPSATSSAKIVSLSSLSSKRSANDPNSIDSFQENQQKCSEKCVKYICREKRLPSSLHLPLFPVSLFSSLTFFEQTPKFKFKERRRRYWGVFNIIINIFLRQKYHNFR